MQDPRVRRAWSLLTLSIAALTASTLIRFAAGLSMDLPVLIVEGYHVLIDLILSLFIIVALLLIRGGASKRYPYGLYKLEDLVAFSLSLIILVEAAYYVPSLGGGPPPLPLPGLIAEAVTLPLLALSTVAKQSAATMLKSPALKADAAHMWVDVSESTAVTIGLAIYLVEETSIVYKASLLIAVIGLVAAAYEAAKDSVLALLDLPVNKEIVKLARDIARSVTVSRGAQITDIRLRWAGPAIFVEARLKVHPLASIEEASEIAQRLEDALREALEGLVGISTVIEPSRRESLVVAIPLREPSPKSLVAERFGDADYFLVARIERGSVEVETIASKAQFTVYHNSASPLVGADLAEALCENRVTDVIVDGIDELAYALLLRHRIVVWKAVATRTALDNLEALARGELKRLENPTHEASWRSA
ncbi:MAG: cation diffusion facilitator family transporter [Desulfurococcales archaeon]|nr:cation diffusion facilitator family transporter [Desulfurococcales archaeon]